MKLRTLADFPSDIIAPGVFKARYGSHGDELILLTHVKSENKLLGSKLTVSLGNQIIILQIIMILQGNHTSRVKT